MYCKQCGEEITNEKAVICVKCGTNKGIGDNYCSECGAKVNNKDVEVCLNCGVRLKEETNNFTNKIKDVTSNSLHGKDKGKIALMIAIGGYVASLIPHISSISGIIVLAGAILAMQQIKLGYKASGNKGLLGYIKYVLNGMTGKDSSANRLACIAVFLGMIVVVLIIIGLVLNLGGNETESQIYYFWTY